MIKKADILIIAAVLMLAALVPAFFTIAGAGKTDKLIEIYIDSKLSQTLPLPAGEELFYIDTEEGYNILMLSANGVKMTDADCPSLDCVHSPGVHMPGEIIACLPHKVLVRVAGTTESGVDAVAG